MKKDDKERRRRKEMKADHEKQGRRQPAQTAHTGRHGARQGAAGRCHRSWLGRSEGERLRLQGLDSELRSRFAMVDVARGARLPTPQLAERQAADELHP